MELIEVAIEGTPPGLLCHNPAGMGAPADAAVSKKSHPTPAVEAAAGVYRDSLDRLAFPMFGLRGCVLSAAKGRRIAKTAATTIVKGSVFVADEWMPLTDVDDAPLVEWEVDARRAVVQRQGITRGRPKFPKWRGMVRFEYDPDFIGADNVRELLTIGGRTVGIGDFRPEKSGPFGRFHVLD